MSTTEIPQAWTELIECLTLLAKGHTDDISVSQRLADETGGCQCDRAYADRGMQDPACAYCQASGDEFGPDADRAAVAAVLETLATHTAPTAPDGPARVHFLNHSEFVGLAAQVRGSKP